MRNKNEDILQLPSKPEELHNSTLLERLKQPKCWTSIPLLNYTPLDQLKDLSVVRFRGMIQDMLDPEIYLESYQVKAAGTAATRIQAGKYRDCLVLNEGEEVDYEATENVQGERRTLFVVSIPGINPWTQNYEEQCNQRNLTEIATTSQTNTISTGIKRSAPSDECVEKMQIDAQQEAKQNNSTTSVVNNSNKRQCTETGKADAVAHTPFTLGREYLLNSPIPERPGKACMVKIYSDFDAYTLNSIIDVVGFLSLDPVLDATNMDVDMCKDFENPNELQAQNPPPSLIPRLHAIAVHQLPHPNPLLDLHFLPHTDEPSETFNMLAVQKDLRMLLTLCLCNDELAADYLLSHLISTVYTRSEMLNIGKFALNLCNLPKDQLTDYTKNLYEILELLLPVSHYLPITLENMNTATFVPIKDYETNKLVSGLLQLAPHTHLVLDETKMQQGKLEANGVLGIQNLAHLINQQQIKCDFRYYDIDYNADVPVLVLSEGKSMLPNDFIVPLKTDNESVELMTETFKAAHHFLQPARLAQFRRFLTMAKICDFDMHTAQNEMIQNDFVEMRRANIIRNADGLHALLVLSRLLAIARGKTTLDEESWELAKDMEEKRRQRVQALPKSRIIYT